MKISLQSIFILCLSLVAFFLGYNHFKMISLKTMWPEHSNVTHISTAETKLYSNSDVAIVTLIYNHYATSSFTSYSRENKEKYCKATGCTFIESDGKVKEHYRGLWNKIVSVISALNEGYPLIWLLDFDTIIMDQNFIVAEITDETHDIYLGLDCNGINTGSVLIRNSNWTIEYFKETLKMRDNGIVYQFAAQGAMSYLFQSNWKDSTSHIKVIDRNIFNAYSKELSFCTKVTFIPGIHPVLHFPSCSVSKKCEKLFKMYKKYSNIR